MVKDKSTEQRIFNAARKVFMQKGLAGARMQEIADEAGINKALLHYYFRTKERLFDAIFQEVFQGIAKGFGEILQDDMDVKSKLKKLIDMYLDNLMANRYLPHFVLNEMNQDPRRIGEMISKNVAVFFAGFFEQIREEGEKGIIRQINPFHFFLNLMGMLVFPFVASPFISLIMKENFNIDFDTMLLERKQEVYDFIENALKPNSEK